MKEGDETKIRKPCMDRFHGTYCRNMTQFFGEKNRSCLWEKLENITKKRTQRK